MSREARTALALELARPLVRCWWTVVAGVCLGLAAGLVAYPHVPKTYRAAAIVTLRAGESAVDLRTRLIRPEVLIDAIRPAGDAALDARRIGGLISGVEVAEVAPGRVEVAVRDSDPREALRLVGALVAGLGAGHDVLRPAGDAARVVAPRRVQVYLLGLALGLLVLAGPPLVRSAVNPPICSAAALRSLTPLPLLASIPRLRTLESRGDMKRRLALNVALSALSGVILAVAVYRALG